MTAEEIKDRDDRFWEAERQRLINYRRLRRFEERLQFWTNVILMSAALAAGAIILWGYARRDLNERAAWLEGYNGIDRATALALAKEVR